MDKYVLESFINYCDEMMIAEEALGNVATVADTLNKRVYILKAKLNDADTTKDKINVISELKSYLIKYKSDIEKVKPNLFDSKFAKILAKSLGLAVSVILIPCTLGLSIMGVIGFSVDIATTDTVKEMKKKLISGIDGQIKNCDIIIKYLESNDVATEGMKDFIQNRKHIHSIREENKRVRKEYKELTKSKPKNSSYSYNYENIKNKAYTSQAIKNFPKTTNILKNMEREILKSFNQVIKDLSNGEFKVNFSTNLDPDDNNIILNIYGNENDFSQIYNTDEKLYERIISKMNNELDNIVKKYNKYYPEVDSNPDDSCGITISIDNED